MVLVAQRWILARLRKRTFFDLAELNTAIRELVDALNGRLMQKLKGQPPGAVGTARSAGSQASAGVRYEPSEWTPCRVNIDYHVEVARHLYSVPYQLVGQLLEARYTSTVVEIYHGGRRLESYPRRHDRRRHDPRRAHAQLAPGAR